ncbi:MAG: adenine phosphoribosyltransferase [Bacilli bacterium]|jgi:adenine phosphoribosyltransferase|nr:adenine phosphoribosyltransferase [Bacilli bacterium]MCH4210435.1 adenine phosphoribosyltransferase [Bacilli bacterium]MCH4228737.1 adenine phosphoribosyltransferase [Bacilli bacterium]MCH4278275.1 adenine phosphoribosyltransferase [Bacilli bacterium]MCI2055015.1 adenine phosphoribosyltransferase [Bacilli bacterium]
MDYEKYVGVVNGFPKEGISFKDISPLLNDPIAFKSCIDDLAKLAEKYHPDAVVAPESRGFVFASALAYKMGISFVMARKAGKLPGKNYKVSYSLEYGEATLEVREDSFKKGTRVILLDDLIATGGSFKALEELTKKAGGTPVAALSFIYLKELEGEKALDIPFEYLLSLSAKE